MTASMRLLLGAIFLLQLRTSFASSPPWSFLLSSASLYLPPAVRLKFPGGEDALKQDCRQRQAASKEDASFVWANHVTEGYELATCLFDALLVQPKEKTTTTLWFPSFQDDSVARGLVQVLRDNAARLGDCHVQSILTWPEAPCLGIQWTTTTTTPLDSDCCLQCTDDSKEDAAAAVKATETWVKDTLCRLRLCPYTASLSRAAVGLESAQVSTGPIVVRHAYESSSCESSSSTTPAALVLAATFWRGVSELATASEQTVATSLLVAPSIYDTHVMEFLDACSDLIEASVQVVQADTIVGRAWFHPHYQAAQVGHDAILPGHALPASMVQKYVQEYYSKDNDASTLLPSLQQVAHANDAVRWTPHATINLLRRSQLTAAKQVEAVSSNKKPNFVYAHNVIKILGDSKEQERG